MRPTLRLVLFATLLAGCGRVDGAEPRTAALDEVAPGPETVVVTDRVAMLGPDARAALDESRLPVLLPADEDLLATAVVTSGPHFVAWGADGEGVHVSLHGTDYQWAIGDAPPEPPIDQVRSRRAYVSMNEGIQMASWIEDGVAWALDVECDAVERDARCASDTYVRELAESLERVEVAR
ncbi:MAG: hypothetical protein R3B82_11950 [Sandaracinaceae bacterium]